ncbi:MAG: helix-turn-helix domain-containing protein [Candidatus Pacebacteria bacterium]|nr:helix-turn-helix domain-containing protein [Candidatus Paceibacterota bacterium]
MHPAQQAVEGIVQAYPDFRWDNFFRGKVELPESPSPKSRLLSTVEATEYLGGISRMTLYRLVKGGQLRSVKIGTRTLFDVEDLDGFIKRHKSKRRKS